MRTRDAVNCDFICRFYDKGNCGVSPPERIQDAAMQPDAHPPIRGRHELLPVLQKYWGYGEFLPLQEEAMRCVLAERDSVVVLPTGGGKSLCFQAPAMCREGVAIVVSPLISLMKDQVDALRNCGIPAAAIHSMIGPSEKQRVVDDVHAGRLRLLYVAPERLLRERTFEFLQRIQLSFFAIDEAHCISAWGHDFRPEYRELSMLKEAFPGKDIHAYTATASVQVRQDIVEQLGLVQPRMLVGSFDRPNLVYKVQRRGSGLEQIRLCVERHPGESGIVYCIARKDVDRLCQALTDLGYRALPYHAGLSDQQRQRHQDAFIAEQADVIVATVAFGMGIDKSNVRYVIHAGMPKSLEHYQQESGRAGRDGLEAECCLLFSGADFLTWKRMIEESEPDAREGALVALHDMDHYCHSVVCRHASLVRHFGQQLASDNCAACDVCLGQLDQVDDPLTIGKKIVSCVLRLRERFGADYTALVLVGSRDQRIVQQGHDRLSTWGILAEVNKNSIRDWIEQLVGQKFLLKEGEYHVLKVTESGRRLLRGELTPRLLKPSAKSTTERSNSARSDKAGSGEQLDAWAGVDRSLFDLLRKFRQQQAADQHVPAYIVFSDAALRDMARRRPSTLDRLLHVRGVGEKKRQDYGLQCLALIADHCLQNNVPMDIDS
ncbi:MAG: DNA helicase RecQ [Planctomycetota bacterium]|nr:DNA helicase RecQ [Planctomycetota bacterium]